MQSIIYQFLIKAVFAACMTFLFIQCGSDSNVRDQAVESAKQNSSDPNAPATKTPSPARPAVVGSLPMTISKTSAEKGTETCVSVSATQFTDIVSMQYTMTWDAEVLKYKEVKNFGLPSLTAQSFGARAVDKGILAYSWYDPNVQGISKPDGNKLYDVCFEVIGDSGSSSSIEFADSPVVIEISNSNSQFLDIAASNGKVDVN